MWSGVTHVQLFAVCRDRHPITVMPNDFKFVSKRVYLNRKCWERSKEVMPDENTRDPLSRGGQAKHVHSNWLGSGSFPITNGACFFFFFFFFLTKGP